MEEGDGAIRSVLAATTGTPPGGPGGGADELVRRHFARHEMRPPHLQDLAPAQMDPFLRGLLFTDGTVTRTLEVKTLSRVAVNVVGQAVSPLPAEAAEHLYAAPESPAVRRRVLIGPAQEGAEPAIWAESHILAERLPEEFIGVLNDSRDGIGGSLQRVELESWREMLWFGLDAPPEWSFVAPRAPSPVLTRLYRVICGGRPALLISESFAVERRGDSYSLRWPERPQAEPNSSSIS